MVPHRSSILTHIHPKISQVRATSWASPGAKLVLNVGHLLVGVLKGGEWLNQDVKSCRSRPFIFFFCALYIFILINDWAWVVIGYSNLLIKNPFSVKDHRLVLSWTCQQRAKAAHAAPREIESSTMTVVTMAPGVLDVIIFLHGCFHKWGYSNNYGLWYANNYSIHGVYPDKWVFP